jgi:thiamine biosynthesis protein ThiS
MPTIGRLHLVTARRAVADGASYLGVGPAYPTATKAGLPAPIGPAGVAAVAAAVVVPVVAIGGITAARVGGLLASGAYGVAVVGAISDADAPRLAAERLSRAVTEAVVRLGGEVRPDRGGTASDVTVTVNAVRQRIAAGSGVHAIVAPRSDSSDSPDIPGGGTGIAVAVNGTVVPRDRWATTILRDGDDIEVLTAVQGG